MYYPNNFAYRFNHKKLIKPSPSITKVKSYGGKSGREFGEIYSIKALVKVNKNWFKNQLLFHNLSIGDGDSGSIITDKNDNILGLYMAGSSELKVANNLFNFFNKINQSSNYNITLKSFH